jgi:hypothetical protein
MQCPRQRTGVLRRRREPFVREAGMSQIALFETTGADLKCRLGARVS